MAFYSNWFKSKPKAPQKPSFSQAVGAGAQGFKNNYSDIKAMLGSMKKGGSVRKTGMYRLHKGERVLTKREAAMDKAKKD